MAVEMEPEGVLLHLLGEGQGSALWHLADVEQALTWCGLDIGYGNPRRRWAETPEERRCGVCVDRLQGTT